jgi:hypothetical protein
VHQEEENLVPNDQLQASVEDLEAQLIISSRKDDNQNLLRAGGGGKDDIVIKSSYGSKRSRGGRVEVASPEPKRGAVGRADGLVRVQLEESGEVLEVEAKYLEEVSER